MRIGGIPFSPIWVGSGGLGFFGEGYWYHRWYEDLIPGFSMDGITFVAKTVTNEALQGNMPLHSDWTPKERLPRSIWISPWSFRNGVALNAIGLSNHGIEKALKTESWQLLAEPFMLSWMPRAGMDPIEEARTFVQHLVKQLPQFQSKLALQVNLSCPNTDEDLASLTGEAVAILKVLEDLGIPLIPKFNILTRPDAIADIASKARVDTVVMSNTIPHDQWPAFETKYNLFDYVPKRSPLAHRGLPAGGISGTPVYKVVANWFEQARGITDDIDFNFCGGVMSPWNVEDAMNSFPNVHSVSVATALMLRPWRIKDIVTTAYRM